MSLEPTSFSSIVAAISRTHALLAAQAGRAINISLLLRNQLIGDHIAKYEVHDANRSKYGERLLARLVAAGLRRIEPREPHLFQQFYAAYPQIREAVTPISASLPAISGVELHDTSPRVKLERLLFTHFVEVRHEF